MQSAAVVGEGDQQPLGGHVLPAAQVEAGEPNRALDDAEDRLDSLFAFL